jgi:prefoldin subunit 5
MIPVPTTLSPQHIESNAFLVQLNSLESLKNSLQTLTQWITSYSSSHQDIKTSVLVPFSKYAFIPGTLIPNQRILVALGENYFVEVSPIEAIAMINRKLEGKSSSFFYCKRWHDCY